MFYFKKATTTFSSILIGLPPPPNPAPSLTFYFLTFQFIINNHSLLGSILNNVLGLIQMKSTKKVHRKKKSVYIQVIL